MQTVYNRYSPDGIKDYQTHDAAMFNFEIEFELSDIDRYAAILNTHFNTSKVSTVYQMLALILMTEGSPGKFIAFASVRIAFNLIYISIKISLWNITLTLH